MARLLAAERRSRRRRAPRARSGRRPSVSTTLMPCSAMARRKPRLVITVTTTVSCGSRPRSWRSTRADGDDVVAVDHAAVLRRRRAAGRRRRRRPGRRRRRRLTTACWSDSGWVEPQPALMLRPVGLGVDHGRRRRRARRAPRGADRRRRAVGAVEHDAQAVEAAAVERRRHEVVGVARRRRRRRGRRCRPRRRPAGRRAGDRLALEPGELGLERVLDVVGRACARRRAKSLMPLSAKGLCEAEIIAAGARRRPRQAGDRRAWARRRGRPTSRPRTRGRRVSAAASSGPDRRVSRPTSERSRAEHPRPRRGRARAASSGVARCWRHRGRRRCRTAGVTATSAAI